jgi:hypothetical protein
MQLASKICETHFAVLAEQLDEVLVCAVVRQVPDKQLLAVASAHHAVPRPALLAVLAEALGTWALDGFY